MSFGEIDIEIKPLKVERIDNPLIENCQKPTECHSALRFLALYDRG